MTLAAELPLKATQADAIAASYGFTSPNATVTVSPVTPSPTGYDAAYTVTITQPQPQYFSSLFVSAPTVGASAEAATVSNGPCVLSLNSSAGTGVSVSGAGTLNLTNCDMDVNSTSSSDAVDSGGAGIFAQNISVDGGTSPTPSAGTAYTAGAITYSGKYKSGTVTANPYANRTMPTAGTCVAPSPGATNNTNYNPVPSGPQNFLPATYSGNFTINTGTTATFSAGSIFTQGIKISGGTVTFATGNYTLSRRAPIAAASASAAASLRSLFQRATIAASKTHKYPAERSRLTPAPMTAASVTSATVPMSP